MKVRLTKRFRFEASHCLDHLPQEHPCFNSHGHSYKVDIEVYGEVDPVSGFMIDYGDLKKIVKPSIDLLDHQHLNNIEDLKYTTTVYLAKWLWDRVYPQLPELTKIIIYETGSTSCEYCGE